MSKYHKIYCFYAIGVKLKQIVEATNIWKKAVADALFPAKLHLFSFEANNAQLMAILGDFCPSVAPNYASLYYRIYSKDLFQTLQHDKA